MDSERANWQFYTETIKSCTRYSITRCLVVSLMQKGQRAEQNEAHVLSLKSNDNKTN